MFFKEMLSQPGWQIYGILALLLFFGAFVAIIAWTLTRSQREIDRQARLPMDEGEPAAPASTPVDRE